MAVLRLAQAQVAGSETRNNGVAKHGVDGEERASRGEGWGRRL